MFPSAMDKCASQLSVLHFVLTEEKHCLKPVARRPRHYSNARAYCVQELLVFCCNCVTVGTCIGQVVEHQIVWGSSALKINPRAPVFPSRESIGDHGRVNKLRRQGLPSGGPVLGSGVVERPISFLSDPRPRHVSCEEWAVER